MIRNYLNLALHTMIRRNRWHASPYSSVSSSLSRRNQHPSSLRLSSSRICNTNRLYHRFSICNTSVAVEIGIGEYFTCAIKLNISNSICHLYSIILGRNWFNMCSTGLEDKPEASVRLTFSNQRLFFAASPVNAICTPSQSHSIESHNGISITLYVHNNLISGMRFALVLIVALLTRNMMLVALVPTALVPQHLRTFVIII